MAAPHNASRRRRQRLSSLHGLQLACSSAMLIALLGTAAASDVLLQPEHTASSMPATSSGGGGSSSRESSSGGHRRFMFSTSGNGSASASGTRREGPLPRGTASNSSDAAGSAAASSHPDGTTRGSSPTAAAHMEQQPEAADAGNSTHSSKAAPEVRQLREDGWAASGQLQGAARALDSRGGGNRKEAYVTLLYGEAFMLGVRVLGQSLRETGTTRELVVLSAGPLSTQAEDTLVNDGWNIRHVDVVQNPGMWRTDSRVEPRQAFPQRFWAVYTKLAIFNMTEYSKVIFLDADTAVMRNMDEAFGCPGFCGVMRHSERLNSGVLVVTPSTATFRDMLSKIQSLPSYTGGDQGFLNSYFYGFAQAPQFDPRRDYSGSGEAIMRLPTVYNADLGLYIINSNRWTIPEEELRVIHFTLGLGKPWNWYATWLVDVMHKWTALRERLPTTPGGVKNGDQPGHRTLRTLLFPLPPVLTLLLLWRLVFRHVVGSSRAPRAQGLAHIALNRTPSMPAMAVPLPQGFQPIAMLAGFLCFGLAAGFTALLIPSDMRPRFAWPLAYEWLLFSFLCLLCTWLSVCYHWGAGASAAKATASGGRAVAGHPAQQRPWLGTALYLLVGCALLALAPWTADVVGLKGLAPRVVVTLVGVAVLAVIWAHTFVCLATLWYVTGRVEAMFRS